MFYDFRKTNELLEKLKITPNQAWFCVMLLEQDYNYKVKLFHDYIKEYGVIDFVDIDALEKLGYIENFANSKVPKTTIIKKEYNYAEQKYITEKKPITDIIILELFMITPKFKELVYLDAEEAAEELLSVYPSWVNIKGKQTPLKKIPDREAFYQYYFSITNGDMLKHKYIVEMFRHYRDLIKKDKVLGMNIINALESKLWMEIEELIELNKQDKDQIDDL